MARRRAAERLVTPAAETISASRRTVRLVVAYDGTAYAGWQAQRDGPPTVQALLTDAARALCGPTARVTGASRTDAGVHAAGQSVSLTIDSGLPPAAILGGLNAALPRDIRIAIAAEAPAGFDARRGARTKRYLYLIDNARIASPLLRRYAWHVPSVLDVGRMRAALGGLRGRHDFSSFRAAAGSAKDPVCRIAAVHVRHRKRRVALVISADRYLHHMVRVIVGSAVEVGRGARDVGWIGEVLAARDRRLAGPTAPPQGLVLLRVMY